MAYILSEAKGGYKGVLVLKHLEIPYWEAMPLSVLEEVKKLYIVAIYFGFAVQVKADVKGVDFYVAADNVMLNYPGLVLRLPLNGFHFIDGEFDSADEYPVQFDYLFVGNSQRRKNLVELVRAISDMISEPNFCIINKVGATLESQLYSAKVRKLLRGFSYSARKRVRYIEIPPEGEGLPSFLMSSLFRSSRALICISRAEGAARVVAEAVLNNLPIVYYSKMVGGTCNHLDDRIDFRVDDMENLPDILDSAYMELLERGRQFRGDGDVYLEENSKKLLLKFLRKNFDGKLHPAAEHQILVRPLYNAFSGHQNHLSESISSSKTDEVLSYVKMFRFLNFLLEAKRSVPASLWIKDFSRKAITPWSDFKGVIKAFIS